MQRKDARKLGSQVVMVGEGFVIMRPHDGKLVYTRPDCRGNPQRLPDADAISANIVETFTRKGIPVVLVDGDIVPRGVGVRPRRHLICSVWCSIIMRMKNCLKRSKS